MVVPAWYLSSWLASDTYKVTHVRLYSYNGSDWTSIPFQIDKRRKINVRYNINNVPSLLQYTDVCEFGYFRELYPPSGSTDPFASDQLQANDEIVFLLNDAGVSGASSSIWPFSDDLAERYQIAVRDLRTNALRFVYAFVWSTSGTPPALNSTDYTSWSTFPAGQGPPASCNAGSPGNCPTDNLCGCFTGSQVGSLLSYKTRYTKNWVVDTYTVLGTGSSNINLLDRWQQGAGPETEDFWSTNRTPRALGSKDGPVRVIRAIQGAASGQDTTRYDYLYPTVQVTRINLRAHPLSDIYHKFDHADGLGEESDVAKRARVWTKWMYEIAVPMPLDTVDGTYTGTPSFGEFYFYDWAEVLTNLTGNRGSYVYLLTEPRPIPSVAKYFTYDDKTAQTLYGAHGRQWQVTGDIQDGYLYDLLGNPLTDENGNPLGNDGGCPNGTDPESSSYKFARMEWATFPRATVNLPDAAGSVGGFEYYENARLPMVPIVKKQIKNQTPTPVTPCTPSQSATPQSTGWVELNISPCSGSGIGYLLYRGIGAGGSLALIKDLRTTTSHIDTATSSGTLYRYAVRAYNEDADLGSFSTEVSVTANDTTPPSIPQKITVTVGSKSATIVWQGSHSRDLQGYNIYLANSSGGPYTKLNGSVYPGSSAKQWQLTGLSLQTYYVTLKSVDMAGNLSSYSTEVSFVPLP